MNRTTGAIALLVIFLMAVLALTTPAAAPPAPTAATASPVQQEQIIKITAKKFEYSPNVIKIKKGVPVVFEFTSLDRVHGFTVPDLDNVRLTIEPGKANRVTIMAPKSGTYEFHCDLFCGEGHEGMTGKIIVED